MSALDHLNDDDLSQLASAFRKWTSALSDSGLPPMRFVTQREIDAATKLMGLFPDTTPMEINGDTDAGA